ncbi:MAG: CaiB/BaiF CoA transferase family protein [Minwuia sp.]|uniref:CaiB/BaiF CoA transferase family protein n=1 Tax=Minwuia sp. TaxID=2493630 RepID=UPI003A8BBB4F
MKPFEGIRILDATHVFAGPYCTYQMAWLGAEVIRVEAVKPLDFIRYASPDEAQQRAGMADAFLIQNANKHSVALDLKDPRGQDAFRKLAATADVVIENYRPGTMAKLGLGPDDLMKDRPDLIYASVSGFGQSGPLRDIPAYDHFVQGVSGMMSVQDDGETGPVRVGWPVIDYVAGLVAAFALSSALYGRKVSGQGQYVDVAMLDAALAIMGPVIGPWLTSQRRQVKTGRQAASGSPFSGMFETADGTLVVAANTQKQAENLLRVAGREDLVGDPAIFPWGGRPDVSERIQPMLDGIFASRTALEWEALLGPAGVPAGKLRSVDEIAAHPHVRARGLIHEIPDVPGLGRGIEVLGPGFGFGDPDAMVTEPTPPPRKGAHSRKYLRDIGLDDAEIDALIADGVVSEPN